MSVTLYERTEALQRLDALIAAADGELTPEMEAEFDAATVAWDEKVEACGVKYTELRAHADALAREADRLAKYAQRQAANAQRLADYVARMMAVRGMTEHVGPRFRFRRVPNPPKVTALLVDPPILRAELDALPEAIHACVTVTPPEPERYAWNKAALLKLAKADPDTAARLARIERGERLTID